MRMLKESVLVAKQVLDLIMGDKADLSEVLEQAPIPWDVCITPYSDPLRGYPGPKRVTILVIT